MEAFHERLSPAYRPGFVSDEHRGRITAGFWNKRQLFFRLEEPLDFPSKDLSVTGCEVLIDIEFEYVADSPASPRRYKANSPCRIGN